ncbi:MAG: hypothetical protein AAB340_00375 [Patescibacteria group bacterium]
MASIVLTANAAALNGPIDLYSFLRQTNDGVRRMHQSIGKDPCNGDDVGGASFAICRIFDNVALTFLGGDCFQLWKDLEGYHFVSGFDQAAHEVEEQDINAYGKCLEQAGGNKGEAWNLYYPHYQEKRVRYANKNIGKGGWATLNGDPTVLQYRTMVHIDHLHQVLWVLIGTDGLLHRHFRPGYKDELGRLYESSGISAVLKWRDEKDYQPHIGHGEHPEASAVELSFN